LDVGGVVECGCRKEAETKTSSWSYSKGDHHPMKSLTQYGCLAEKFWRRWLPKMVAELEYRGRLEAALREAEERTVAEMNDLRLHFQQQGLTAEQAEHRAWEIVRHRYVYLQPEI
jgi:hypothetical protein